MVRVPERYMIQMEFRSFKDGTLLTKIWARLLPDDSNGGTKRTEIWARLQKWMRDSERVPY